MSSIQELRERRAALAAQARKLIDDNPGTLWTRAIADKVDALYAEIDATERGIRAIERDLEAAGNGRRGHATATGTQWRNATTGAPIVSVSREDYGRVAAMMGAAGPEIGVGDFFRAIAGMRTSEAARNALSVGTDGSGGYTVPTVILPKFIEALLPASSCLKAGAQVLPLDRTAKTTRLAKLSTVPTAAWRAEAGSVAESDPAFGALDLTPKSLAFYFKVSRELLADSVNIDEMLLHAIVGAFAKAIDAAALRGTGANTPTGINGVSGVGSVANGTNGATQSSLKWANLLSAYQTVLEANGPVPTAAIMAPRSLVGYASLADSTGQPLQRPALLNDTQFIATSAIPVNLTVGGSNDCTEVYVGDYRELIIGLREDVSIMRAAELHAGTGEVGFYCHSRVDIAPMRAAAFCKISGIRAG